MNKENSIDSIGSKYVDGPEVDVPETPETPAPTPAAPASVGLNLTFEQFKELLTPKVSEADKKKQDAELKAIADAQQNRKDNAEVINIERQRKLAEQRDCSHIRRDGSCRAVYVEHGNYLICQRCQDVIRPGEMLKDPVTGKDTDKPNLDRRALFTRLFSMAGRNADMQW
jgi:hypothetical protein